MNIVGKRENKIIPMLLANVMSKGSTLTQIVLHTENQSKFYGREIHISQTGLSRYGAGCSSRNIEVIKS